MLLPIFCSAFVSESGVLGIDPATTYISSTSFNGDQAVAIFGGNGVAEGVTEYAGAWCSPTLDPAGSDIYGLLYECRAKIVSSSGGTLIYEFITEATTHPALSATFSLWFDISVWTYLSLASDGDGASALLTIEIREKANISNSISQNITLTCEAY